MEVENGFERQLLLEIHAFFTATMFTGDTPFTALRHSISYEPTNDPLEISTSEDKDML